jgi:hypothetical protein
MLPHAIRTRDSHAIIYKAAVKVRKIASLKRWWISKSKRRNNNPAHMQGFALHHAPHDPKMT